MKTFKYIAPIVKKRFVNIILGILILLVVDAIQLVIPRIVKKAIDGLGKEGFTQHDLLITALIIIGMSVVIYFLKMLWRIVLIGNSWRIEKELRQNYYNHLMLMSQNFFTKSKTGDLMARATNDMNAIRMMFGFGFIALVDTIFLSVSSFMLMVTINFKLTMMAILPLPVMTVFIIIFGRKVHLKFKDVQESFSGLSGMIQENISGIRVVKAFVQEKNETDKMCKLSQDYVEKNIALVKLNAMFHPFMWLIISYSIGIVVIFGGITVIKNVISVGSYVAFSSYLGQLIWPMIAIGWVVNMYQRGTASLKRINQILDTEPEITNAHADDSLTHFKGNIKIDGLDFAYPGTSKKILENVSVEVNIGETLAIAGRTGCGKSTLIDLIMRVYDPPENSIFLDSKQVSSYPLSVLHSNIAAVPQDIFLFSDTIENNIKFGKPDASLADVERVAKMANVYNDIIEFSEGFQTVVGERGVTLSGGQKQRIAIARAFLTDPEILILDDSLSAVDTKTEKSIIEQTIELRKNKTTIIIAHRISSIQHANKIIVIDNGKIAEEGTHEELLENGKLYHDLHEKQQIAQRLEED